LIFGYGLKEITSVTIAQIVKEYNISISKSSAQSILIGIMPLGCIFGAILTKFLMQKFRRLSPIKFFAMINIGAIVLVNINNFTTLIIGRFI
jgi:predicted MFS family arabinose efflux permease